MPEYRIKHKPYKVAFDEVCVQEKRWWGWKTIASFWRSLDGLRDARDYIRELEETDA